MSRPRTVADVLLALWMLYAGVRDRVATEQGQIREYINIFVGDEDVRYSGGLPSRYPFQGKLFKCVQDGCSGTVLDRRQWFELKVEERRAASDHPE